MIVIVHYAFMLCAFNGSELCIHTYALVLYEFTNSQSIMHKVKVRIVHFASILQNFMIMNDARVIWELGVVICDYVHTRGFMTYELSLSFLLLLMNNGS